MSGAGEVDTGDGTLYYTLVEWQDAIASCLSSPKSFGQQNWGYEEEWVAVFAPSESHANGN